MNKFITIRDAAAILGVSKITLRNWDKSGRLKAHRHPFNNYRVYKLEDIESVIDLIESSRGEIIKKKDDVRRLMVKHLEEDAELSLQDPQKQ
jgi:excisionase family DNA binding protein